MAVVYSYARMRVLTNSWYKRNDMNHRATRMETYGLTKMMQWKRKKVPRESPTACLEMKSMKVLHVTLMISQEFLTYGS